MQIDVNVLKDWGAVSKQYNKNEVIYDEDEPAICYYQIQEGQVKLVNLSNDGREFVHGVYAAGQCFGESLLFINENYPTAAVALEPCLLLKLSKDKLLKLLAENPPIQAKFLQTLAQLIYNKTVTAREIVNNNPEGRILAFLRSMKSRAGNHQQKALVPFTRQEIANFTGLRVETVIRTLKHMEEKNKVTIIDHKLWF